MNKLKTFKQFITEMGFKHSMHLENSVIDLGVNGTRNAILALKDFRDHFAGVSNKKLNLTIKWDGSPACIAGYNPENGKFFVGSKSIFNADPKINYTHEDIDRNHSGGLADKLHDALTYLPLVYPKGRIFQGDFMFSKRDLGSAKINGEDCYVMHPNTIAYTVPKNSDLGKTIGKAQMGIVVHTEYHGKSLTTMNPSFGASIDGFNKNSKVWVIDANLEDTTGIGNLTAEETAEIDGIISDCGSLFQAVNSSTFKLISQDKELNILLNTFENTKIRAGIAMDPHTHAIDFVNWVIDKHNKEIAGKKSSDGKAKVEDRLTALINRIDIEELTDVFRLQSRIADGKSFVLGKLNEIGSLGTYLKTADGFKVTNHEGFVGVSGDIAGIKLVDRLTFSKNNFDTSGTIIKGWTK